LRLPEDALRDELCTPEPPLHLVWGYVPVTGFSAAVDGPEGEGH
jgi:hypothetical protein